MDWGCREGIRMVHLLHRYKVERSQCLLRRSAWPKDGLNTVLMEMDDRSSTEVQIEAQTLVSSYSQPRCLLRASWRVKRGMPSCKHVLPSSENFLSLENSKTCSWNLSSFVRHSKAARNRENTWESFYLVINPDSDHPCMIAQLAWERAGCSYVGFLC